MTMHVSIATVVGYNADGHEVIEDKPLGVWEPREPYTWGGAGKRTYRPPGVYTFDGDGNEIIDGTCTEVSNNFARRTLTAECPGGLPAGADGGMP